jgi:hypothetical protein
MKKKYTVFIIQAYEERIENGQLRDVVIVEVIADKEKDAIKKARGYVNKPFYRVTQIIENYV